MRMTFLASTRPNEIQDLFYQTRKKLRDEAAKLPKGVIGPCFNDEYADGSVEKMRLEFKSRRDYLIEEISKMRCFSCHKPEGAFYIFLNIKKTGMSSAEFSDYMLENYRIAFVPGDIFGKNGEGYVRLSYAASMSELQECIRILNLADEEFSK